MIREEEPAKTEKEGGEIKAIEECCREDYGDLFVHLNVSHGSIPQCRMDMQARAERGKAVQEQGFRARKEGEETEGPFCGLVEEVCQVS